MDTVATDFFLQLSFPNSVSFFIFIFLHFTYEKECSSTNGKNYYFAAIVPSKFQIYYIIMFIMLYDFTYQKCQITILNYSHLILSFYSHFVLG